MGYGWYLPQVLEHYTDAAGKRRRRTAVLFSDYVPFCLRFPEDLVAVRSLRPVCEVLVVPVQQRFVKQINSIFIASQSATLRPFADVVEGKKVRIGRPHPLAGVEGVIIRRDDKDVLVIQADMMGQAVSIEDVELGEVELID